ncbi:VOC family protein [Mycobacterium sp. SMC-19]|uniref:VOC family protein n=1 Tax=Mycobacterium sp. SMC-19 TaxID=3381630 RepID=UPI0038777365
MKLGLLVLYVSDLERAHHFYGAVLGLPLVQEQHGSSGPVHYSATLSDGAVLELYPAGSKPPTRTRLSLQLPDVATAADAARAAGFTVRTMKWGLLVDGPDDVVVELRLLKDDAYWEALSSCVEAGDYTTRVTWGGPRRRSDQLLTQQQQPPTRLWRAGFGSVVSAGQGRWAAPATVVFRGRPGGQAAVPATSLRCSAAA